MPAFTLSPFIFAYLLPFTFSLLPPFYRLSPLLLPLTFRLVYGFQPFGPSGLRRLRWGVRRQGSSRWQGQFVRLYQMPTGRAQKQHRIGRQCLWLPGGRHQMQDTIYHQQLLHFLGKWLANHQPNIGQGFFGAVNQFFIIGDVSINSAVVAIG
jgi:hypothetical protein